MSPQYVQIEEYTINSPKINIKSIFPESMETNVVSHSTKRDEDILSVKGKRYDQ